MGKKVKIGKTRKDKFYQLAKESGYRSRAAFKLLQLNRTYHFLEKSRICIDLCAAPGGWLQVACTHMPMSSIIIGVDLAPIKPIGNVITHMEDITTPKCRQLIKKDLNDAKADVVLHDGAPNVGKNWVHDAYHQNMLVLQSFKLATEFLRKGGWFITKVFRSKDYYSLLWVFQQLFKKVDSTKPQASRNESAEIFVVCQNFLAPDQIDEKFFDIKYVFSDAMNEESQAQSKSNLLQTLLKPKLNQRHRDGYADDDYTLFHRLNASEFVKSNNFVELLAKSNQIILDDEKIIKNSATTNEIKECLNDLRVLGTNDIKNLLKWRLKMKDMYENEKVKTENKEEEKNNENKKNEEGSDEDDEEKIDEEIEKTLDLEKKMDKKKRKKLMKEKRKLRDKIALKMENPEDANNFDLQNERELFSLTKIKTKKQLIELQEALPGLELSSDDDNNDDDDIDIENGLSWKRKTKAKYSKDKDDIDDFYANIENGNEIDANNEEINGIDVDDNNEKSNNNNDDNDDEEEDNPLITDLVSENKNDKKKSLANSWFNKGAFDFLRDKNVDENELMNELDNDEDKNEKKLNETSKRVYHSDSDDDDCENENELKKQKTSNNVDLDSDSDSDSDDEKVDKKKKVKLTPYELAVGEMIVNSKEAKDMLVDESYNRYSNFGDPDDLPKWFVEDEKTHFKKDLPVPQDTINKYNNKTNETINTRSIKKVVEAQARKKRRMTKKLDKARRKAEVIAENMDMNDKERQKEIKHVYKRAGLLGKKKVDVKYVVAKKSAGKRGVAGKIKGPYKVVDKRLKKDKRVNKNKKGGRGGGGGGRGGKKIGRKTGKKPRPKSKSK